MHHRFGSLVDPAAPGHFWRAARERGAYCDADAEEDDDAAVEKARAWDDWKDSHPFGYGNSQTNPCPPGQMRGAARGNGGNGFKKY